MDAIALHQAGFDFAVAACGTSFTEDQAQLLSRYCSEVVVTMDADEAGQKATDRATAIIKKTGLAVKVLQIDGGKDPDEYIKTYGADKFRLLLDGAKNDIDFALLKSERKYDLTLDSDRVEYLKEAVEILARTEDEIAVDIYAGRLAEQCRADKRTITDRIKQRAADRRKYSQRQRLRNITRPNPMSDNINPEERQHKRAAAAERSILSVLMQDSYLYDSIKNELSPDDFVTQFHRRVYIAVSQLLSRSQAFDITVLSADFTPEEMGRIAGLGAGASVYKNPEEQLRDCIAVLKQEKSKTEEIDVDNLDNDGFASIIDKIGKNKK